MTLPEYDQLKILVVDDEADARFLLTEILIESGFIVEEADNVQKALEAFETFCPHILLTDVRMPGEDGISLLKKVKALNENCYVIIMTGHGDKQTAVDALKSGAGDFLDKPFEDEELLAAVSRASELIKAQLKLKVAEAQATQASKLASIGYLAAGMAHEINNPLQILMGTIDLMGLQSGASEDEKFSELMGIQKDCTRRIKNIVQGMRTYARTKDECSEVFDVHELILESVKMIQVIFSKKGVSLEAELLEEKVFIKGNQQFLQQALMNLISNAGDATEKATKRIVKVSTHRSENKVRIGISDTGSGMSKEVQERLFEPFFTTKDPGKGTGMGMSITQKLVQLMSGSIEVSSELGNGTTFTLEFDIESSPGDSKTSPSQSVPELSGRILIVDDEEYIRKVLSALIKPTGLDIDTAENGRVGLKKLENEAYDLVITDVNMPQMTGVQMMENIKKQNNHRDLKFVRITGGLPSESVEGEARAEDDQKVHDQFDGVLAKPFSKEEIYAVLQQLLSENIPLKKSV